MYLNNDDLYVEIVYSKGLGYLTPNAQIMLETLAKRCIKKFRYSDNDLRNDCYQSALLDIFQNWHNYNEHKTDLPFAYFTEIFKRGAARGLNEITKKKGDSKIRMISLDSSNEGSGLHNI